MTFTAVSKALGRTLQTKKLPILAFGLFCMLLWQILREPNVQESALKVYGRSRQVFEDIAASRPTPVFDQSPHQAAPPDQHNVAASQRVLFYQPGVHFYVHRAFWDDREGLNVVRIFGIESRSLVSGNFTCRWTDQSGGVNVSQKVTCQKYLITTPESDSSQFLAFNIDCKMPMNTKPVSISLSSTEHGIKFEIRVEDTNRSTPRKDLAVCVKPITNKIDVSRLVEWIELQRLVGVENFILYNTDLTGPGRFVLEYYAEQGIATIVSFPYLPAILKKVEPPFLTPQGRFAVYQQLYLVAYHDCLYRFRGMYRFLEFIDLDEVILPAAGDEPMMMMIRMLEKLVIQKPSAASFVFLTAWHFQDPWKVTSTDLKPETADIPDYLFFMKHAIASTPVDKGVKSVVLTDRAITVGFHELLETTGETFTNQVVPWESFGYLHHFRGKCKDVFSQKHCDDLLKKARVDSSVVVYKDRLQKRVRDVLDHLQLTRHSLD